MSKQDQQDLSKTRKAFVLITTTLEKWLAIDFDDYLLGSAELPKVSVPKMLSAFDNVFVRDAILAYYSNPELKKRGVTDATEQCAIRERVADYFQAWCETHDYSPTTAPSHLIVMMAGLLHYNAVERFGAYAFAPNYVEQLGGAESENSLTRLLDMAFRHNVPARVWVKSIDEVIETAYEKLDSLAVSEK